MLKLSYDGLLLIEKMCPIFVGVSVFILNEIVADENNKSSRCKSVVKLYNCHVTAEWSVVIGRFNKLFL